MNRTIVSGLCWVASLGLGASALAAQGKANRSPSAHQVSGKDAVAAVRHDWKAQAGHTVRAKQTGAGSVPANFGRLSPEARLAYLHARRNLDPARFDRFHGALGRQLALDDRLRLAQSQDCRPMNGLLPNSARTNYLQHRRSLNPTRFDVYHPTLGAILAEDDALKTGKGCVSPEIIPPPVVVPPPGIPGVGPPTGGNPPGNPVPEPGSLTLIVLGCVGALTPRLVRRLRRSPVPASE